MGLADHARQLVAYGEWANNQLLAAAARLDQEQYATVRDAFAHLLGTQQYWYANWTGGALRSGSGDVCCDALGVRRIACGSAAILR